MQFGSVAVVLSLLLQGPSHMLGLPASTTPMLISFLLVGFLFPFVNMPTIPTLVEAIEIEQREKIPNFVTSQRIIEISSVLWNMTFGIGSIIAPLLGGGLNDLVGYQRTTDFIVLICTSTSLVYLIFVTIPIYKK